jgi:hypothetical protein
MLMRHRMFDFLTSGIEVLDFWKWGAETSATVTEATNYRRDFCLPANKEPVGLR